MTLHHWDYPDGDLGYIAGIIQQLAWFMGFLRYFVTFEIHHYLALARPAFKMKNTAFWGQDQLQPPKAEE
jgi:hypothetical protein